MALLTPISPVEAQEIARAHGLGPVREVLPLTAGSVNTNAFLVLPDRRVFLRVYEEQEVDGVRYEWALLDHLVGAGLPVTRRVPGPLPGEVTVAGKPIALFEEVPGEELCFRMVTAAHLERIGALLAKFHRAGQGFPIRKRGRFDLEHLPERHQGIRDRFTDAAMPVDLETDLARIEAETARLIQTHPQDLVAGVVHGDLFRDNVRWFGGEVAGLLDWESASDGLLLSDAMVVVLSWCFGDTLELDKVRRFFVGYQSIRRLEETERAALAWAAKTVCIRFATTRIESYELRKGDGTVQYRDFRRFLSRWDAIDGLGSRLPELLLEQ